MEQFRLISAASAVAITVTLISSEIVCLLGTTTTYAPERFHHTRISRALTLSHGTEIMIVIISIESTARRARRLTEVLPTVLLPDSFLLWKAQFLANCSTYLCHMVLRRPPRYQGRQRVIESRLARLSTQAEILKSERQRLESEIKAAEA